MILFENPQAFFFLFSIPLLYILRHLGIFSRISFPLTISYWDGKTFVYRDNFTKIASIVTHFLANAAYVSLVLALANPIIRHQEKIYTSRGTDILFVLDISPSMAARDISLSSGQLTRLEAAKLGSLWPLRKKEPVTVLWPWQAKPPVSFPQQMTSKPS